MLARASGALTLPENLSDDLSGYLRNPTQFVEHFWPATGAKFRPFFPMAFPIRLTPDSRTGRSAPHASLVLSSTVPLAAIDKQSASATAIRSMVQMILGETRAA